MEARAGRRGATGARNGRLIAAVLAGAILLGVAAGFGSHLLLTAGRAPAAVQTAEPLFDGEATWAAGARPAPAIDTLRDQNGHLFSLASLHGRPVAIEFFDSHCKQECPLAGRALAAAERPLPRAERPVLVVVSVNPLDTPREHPRRGQGLGPGGGRAVVLAARHARPARPGVERVPHLRQAREG